MCETPPLVLPFISSKPFHDYSILLGSPKGWRQHRCCPGQEVFGPEQRALGPTKTPPIQFAVFCLLAAVLYWDPTYRKAPEINVDHVYSRFKNYWA
jgi:hypothetical protein